jgi:hypothetical protein
MLLFGTESAGIRGRRGRYRLLTKYRLPPYTKKEKARFEMKIILARPKTTLPLFIIHSDRSEQTTAFSDQAF